MFAEQGPDSSDPDWLAAKRQIQNGFGETELGCLNVSPIVVCCTTVSGIGTAGRSRSRSPDTSLSPLANIGYDSRTMRKDGEAPVRVVFDLEASFDGVFYVIAGAGVCNSVFWRGDRPIRKHNLFA